MFLIKINKIKTLKSTLFLLAFLFFGCTFTAFATEPTEGADEENPVDVMIHHICDANEFHIVGDFSIPLPCIAWSEDGLMFTLSSSFEHGHMAVDGYVLDHGVLKKIIGDDFPKGTVAVSFVHAADDHHSNEHIHSDSSHESSKNEEHVTLVKYGDTTYELEPSKALQSMSASWYDFSITKNIFSMLLVFLMLLFVFSKISKAYTKRENQAPKGLQSLMEPLILFMRDDVVKPAIGEKWKKFFPFIMCLFFFILFCNLLGLIPFFPGSANITGNIGVTFVLAMFVFVLVTINGKKDYWQHIFWMPGVPVAIKPVMTIIEVMGMFIKPATLFIRLFANITAGHIVILSLVSLIFFFNMSFGTAGAGVAIGFALPFTFALNLMELFIAFLQAFVFALLAAIYIGTALEEHHHEEAH